MTTVLDVPVAEKKSSTHRVEIVPLVLFKHPNADRLSVAQAFGFTCVVASDQWDGYTKAAYLPPDSVVDVSRPEFSFLAEQSKDGKYRIRAKKLRGVLSFGLLIPSPPNCEIGDDVADLLAVEHYEPTMRCGGGNRGGLVTGGEVASAPNLYHTKYDLEAGRRYAAVCFEDGEPVVVTEKIHGANARYVYHDGQWHCGSRTEWKREYPNYDHITVESLETKVSREKAEEIVANLKAKPKQQNMWWQALRNTPELVEFGEANPDVMIYGEVFGAVQDLNYGHRNGQVSFRAFDLLREGRWLDIGEAMEMVGPRFPWVPFLLENGTAPSDNSWQPMPYNFNRLCELAEGKTLVPGADHLREGIVVQPVINRYHHVGRVKLKWVSAGYLERSE